MLLLLLSCLLPTTNGKNCLQCWQELPALIDYDLQILWGTPGPPAELSQSLHSLFMDNHSSPENSYLGQDHLEEAAGTLFTHIDKAIKKLRDDKPSLLEEVRVLKQQFSKQLEDVSEGLKDKACNESCDIRSTLEVISCTTCQKHFLTCQDPDLCPAWTGKNFMWAMGIGFALPLAILAGGGCYIFWLKKKKKEEEEEEEEEEAKKDLGHPGSPRRESCVCLGVESLEAPSLVPWAWFSKECRIEGWDSGEPPSAPSVSRPIQGQAPGTEQEQSLQSPTDPQSAPCP